MTGGQMEDNKSLVSEAVDKEVSKNSMIETHPYSQELTITKVNGSCPYGHTAGEKFEVDPYNVGLTCGTLWLSGLPNINLLYTGGSLPWEPTPDIINFVCPDFYNVTRYQLVREKR